MATMEFIGDGRFQQQWLQGDRTIEVLAVSDEALMTATVDMAALAANAVSCRIAPLLKLLIS